MTVLLLRPGELSLVPFVPSVAAEYPLDSILVVPYCPDQLQHVAVAIDHAIRFPWLPALIGTSTAGLLPARLDGLANGLHLATLPLSMGARMDAGEIRGAIRARGAPVISHFTNCCGRRCGRGLEPLFVKVLRRAPLSRIESRELGKLGRLGTVQWRRLFLLCQLHADVWANRVTLGQAAHLRGTTRMSAWEWSTKYLGMSWEELKATASWEAISERAIRWNGSQHSLSP